LATGWKWLPAIFVKLNDCPALQVPEKRLPRFQAGLSEQSIRAPQSRWWPDGYPEKFVKLKPVST
jgi:hypothetical protein